MWGFLLAVFWSTFATLSNGSDSTSISLNALDSISFKEQPANMRCLFTIHHISYHEIDNGSIAPKCLRTLSGLFSPNLIGKSSCRCLTTHTKTRPIFHDDWSIRCGGDRPDRVLRHLTAKLIKLETCATIDLLSKCNFMVDFLLCRKILQGDRN